MTNLVGSPDVERFQAAIGQHLGLFFEDARRGYVAEVLQRRLAQLGASAEVYLAQIELGLGHDECAELARELTVGETYFFRNREQFAALAEIALPDRMWANAAERSLRLLSAGCASGEEAYSLAITVRQIAATVGWDVSVRAVDLNPAALKKAARARYTSWALRETSAEAQRRWFRTAGQEFLLDPGISSTVRFDQRNLAGDDDELWRPANLDVVFCRNVIMYFTPEHARALVARIGRALRPGGYLFLGHAETLRGVSDDFHLRHTHGTFYYVRKDRIGVAPLASLPKADELAINSDPVAEGDGWVDVIREASERVAALADRPAQLPMRDLPSAALDLTGILDLLRREQFGEALKLLRAQSELAKSDPDTLLLEATLLTNSGLLPAAEETCRRLLAIDELNAGAHYILALCREGSGDLVGAAEHDRVAAYLDPHFAMPRLHLGLLARRTGDRSAAQRELAQALVLLRHEDASRLLLFAGGFSRVALLGLCDAALRDCGGAP
jgi:chemotaxis protein methyltransferase CheR